MKNGENNKKWNNETSEKIWNKIMKEIEWKCNKWKERW